MIIRIIGADGRLLPLRLSHDILLSVFLFSLVQLICKSLLIGILFRGIIQKLFDIFKKLIVRIHTLHLLFL